MSIPGKYDHTLDLLDGARLLLETELEKAERGERAVDRPEMLRQMQRRLNEIEHAIVSGAANSDASIPSQMARVVVDTWPTNHALGSILVSIEDEYYRMRNRRESTPE